MDIPRKKSTWVPLIAITSQSTDADLKVLNATNMFVIPLIEESLKRFEKNEVPYDQPNPHPTSEYAPPTEEALQTKNIPAPAGLGEDIGQPSMPSDRAQATAPASTIPSIHIPHQMNVYAPSMMNMADDTVISPPDVYKYLETGDSAALNTYLRDVAATDPNSLDLLMGIARKMAIFDPSLAKNTQNRTLNRLNSLGKAINESRKRSSITPYKRLGRHTGDVAPMGLPIERLKLLNTGNNGRDRLPK